MTMKVLTRRGTGRESHRALAAMLASLSLVITGIAVASAASAAPVNLVRDSGFNSGASAWRVNSTVSTALSFPTVDGRGRVAQLTARTGSATMTLNDRVNTVAQTVPGEVYQVSALVRAPKPVVNGSLRVRNVGTTVVTTQRSFSLRNTKWLKVTFNVTITKPGALDVNVLAWSVPASRSLMVDNVSVTRIVSVGGTQSSSATAPGVSSAPTQDITLPVQSPSTTPTTTAPPTVRPTVAPTTTPTPTQPEPTVSPTVQPTTPPSPAPGGCESQLPEGGTTFGSSLGTADGSSIAQAITREEQRFGTLDVVRVFEGGMPSGWSRYSSLNGRDLVASFKAAPAAIIAGTYDKSLRDWFNSAPTDVQVYWSYYHEPEDNIEDGEFTAAQYRTAWKHIAALADETCRTNLHATLTLMGWSTNPSSGRNWHDYYPGSDVVDVMAWDVYSPAGKYSEPSTMFDLVIAASREVNEPFAVAEVGSRLVSGDSGTRRADWLEKVGEELAASDAVFVTYFDSTVGGDFRLLDSPSYSSWREVVN